MEGNCKEVTCYNILLTSYVLEAHATGPPDVTVFYVIGQNEWVTGTSPKLFVQLMIISYTSCY